MITNNSLMNEKSWNENRTKTNETRLWQRQEEVEETLLRNLYHSFVKAVHLLVDQQLAEQIEQVSVTQQTRNICTSSYSYA